MTSKELIDLFDSKGGTRALHIFNYVSEHYPTFNHPKVDLGNEIFKALTELEVLKRDVKRYFELEEQDTFNSQEEHDEFGVLYDKLLKVGVK